MLLTDFDPKIHGFKFRNSFAGGEVVAEVARQERLDDVAGVGVPRLVNQLADVARGMSFWGTFGLCGGMSWAALDAFFEKRPIPASTTQPGPGDQLFADLVTRQVDSMKRGQLIGSCLRFQVLNDRTPWWMFWSKGIHQAVESREWPILRASLANRVPTSLTLIRVYGLGDPSQHHQVVATGLDDPAPGRYSVQIYDPNHPGAVPTLELRFDPGGKLIGCDQSTSDGLRGFIVWPYHPR